MAERVRGEGQDQERENNWGLFHFSLLICSALILALWGVIIRGGEPPPPRTAYVVERPTVLLFLVDTALKGYAHYERGKYPEELSEILPRYVRLRNKELPCLEMLSYGTDPSGGYRLRAQSFARSVPPAVATVSAPYPSFKDVNRAAISSRAWSQETRSHCPAPRPPTLFNGTLILAGCLRC